MFKNFSFAVKIKRGLHNENIFFDNLAKNFKINLTDIRSVKDVIWDYHIDFNVSKVKDMNIKVGHLVCLCSERYLNDEIVDAAMYKFWDTSKEKDQTMCLTTYTCSYLSKSGSGDNISKKNLLRLMQSCMPLNIKQILIPVHVSNCHWGLARIQIPTKVIYFDDSLRWASPVMLLHNLRHLIELLSQLLHNDVNLKRR